MRRRSLPLRLVILGLIASSLLPGPATSAPAGEAAPLRAPRTEPAPEGLAPDRVSLRPSRFDVAKAVRGEELRYELTVTNSFDEPVRLGARVIPLEGSTDPDRYAMPGSSASRSADAVEWVTFPGFEQPREVPGNTQLVVPVSVAVPRDAVPGTYALGLGVAWNTSALGVNQVDTPAGRVDLDAIVSSTAVLRVPGEAAARARIASTDGPRIVWGGGRPTFRAQVENVGETDLVIDAQVELEAFLGSAGRTLSAAGPEDGYPTLPGGLRVLRMEWGDPPLFGWFRPTLVVVGGEGSGVRVTKRLDTVYVLPPWWLVVLLVLAIWLPVRTIRRRSKMATATGARQAKARKRVEERIRRQRAKERARAARRGR